MFKFAEITENHLKSVCVVDNIGGIYSNIAMSLVGKFKNVYYYSASQSPFPLISSQIVLQNVEGITVINSFWDRLENFDIIIFPDIYFKSWGKELRKLGKKVFGGCESELLETNRKLFKQELKSVGLDIAPTQYITGIDNLINYLKDKQDKWIKISYFRGMMETFHHININQSIMFFNNLKVTMGPVEKTFEFMVEDSIPSIAEIGCDTFAVNGVLPNIQMFGVETKDCSYVGKMSPVNMLPKPLQDVNKKFEPILKKYKHTGFYSNEIRVGEDGKDYYTDPCCFSDDTEILTNEGWKLFKDLNKNETVATLNPNTFEIEYHKPYDYIEYEFTGDLINITNDRKTIDKLVTPNHSTWAFDKNGNNLSEYKTEELTGRHFIPRTGIWKGEDKNFILPNYTKTWSSGNNGQIKKEYNKEEIEIDLGDWSEFMGWFLSEGSLGNGMVNITQYKFTDEVKKCLDKLPFEYRIENNGFRILSKQLEMYLRQFGLCYEKYIPDYILNSTSENIDRFLYSFNLGDGSRHRGERCYYTTSKVMAGQISELIFKIGSVSNITKRNLKGTKMIVKNGKEYIRNHDIYVIYETNKYKNFYFEASGSRLNKYIKTLPYNGKVYDVTVDNHIIYVRRDGKPFWSGNCRAGNPPSNSYMQLITNWDEIIVNAVEGKIIEPSYKDKYVCELLLKTTYCQKNYTMVEIPNELRPFVKLKGNFIEDGKDWVIPFDQCGLYDMDNIGSVVVTGNNINLCLEKCLEIAGQLSAIGLTYDSDALNKSLESIQKLEKSLNIKF